jgi:predicted O-linked N-acetylglucosamine transferase (SPINDLY family)
LITLTSEDYADLAIELATNRGKLVDIKARLGRNRLTTPLFDTGLFAKNIETAYQIMYDRYRNGLPPDHILVSA